jgi:endonuclease V-like protein UPF0215 family
MMASAEKQNNMSTIQAQLKEALEQYEESKQIYRALLKVKIYHDQESLRFVLETMKKKMSEKQLENERQKHPEPEQQDGRNPFR